MTVHIPRFLGHWLSTAVALWITDALLRGVSFDSIEALLLGSFALAAVNALVRPLLVIFTFPITVATLGLFLIVINGVCFELAAAFVSGFHVGTFVIAMLGALLTAFGSSVVEAIFHVRPATHPDVQTHPPAAA